MTASGVSNLVFIESTMKKEDYVDILKQNVAPSVEKLELSQNWMFQEKHPLSRNSGSSTTIPRP